MSKRKWTIEKAEAVLVKNGARVKDEKIYMPSQNEIRDLRQRPDDDNEFWSAYQFLRCYEFYSCDSDDIIAYFDFEDL